MESPGSRRSVNRRTILAAFTLGATGIVSACSQPSAAPTSDRADRDDRKFRDPHPRRPGAEDESPTGTYSVPPPRRLTYPVASGDSVSNFGDLYVPRGASAPLPIVVMIHGGGWREPTGLAYMAPLARDLASSGVAVWNIEYRRVHGGGGWPTTLTDVAAAIDFVAELPGRGAVAVDAGNVHLTGHSAGGHLAAWAAGRHTLGPRSPGSAPRVRARSATIMAGVFDLALADDHRHDRFVHGLLGGSDDQVPGRYAFASPISHVPIGIPVTCLHGDADRVVLPEQSRNYVRRASEAGDPATLVSLPGVHHTTFADISSPAWRTARDHLLEAAMRR